jgi:hypothetical protein
MRYPPYERVGREGALVQRLVHVRSWCHGLAYLRFHHTHEAVFANDSKRNDVQNSQPVLEKAPFLPSKSGGRRRVGVKVHALYRKLYATVGLWMSCA